MTMVARKIDECRARFVTELKMLMRMSTVINSLPESIGQKCAIYNDYLDFNGLTRDEVLVAMMMIKAGKWEKSVNLADSAMIDYNAVVGGMKIRLWAAAPPDSCRIIEVEEEVPATRIVRRKLVCSGSEA